MDKSTPQSLSVIITTYNQPKYLESVLLGYCCQTNKNFELVIADDGSEDETRAIIDKFRAEQGIDIKHVWHEDQGFRKCTILNKAIIASSNDYLLFTDGDCIPRKDFIDVHLKNSRQGHFLSGGYFKLNDNVTAAISPQTIIDQKPFSVSWLQEKGQEFTYKFLKLTRFRWLSEFMNFITPTTSTWNGHNVSGWKQDIISVNGYNEDMMYGGLDRELGERLENKGIRGIQVRYTAIVVHLNHPRPYKKRDLIEKNRRIRKEVRDKKICFTPNGIDQHLKEK